MRDIYTIMLRDSLLKSGETDALLARELEKITRKTYSDMTEFLSTLLAFLYRQFGDVDSSLLLDLAYAQIEGLNLEIPKARFEDIYEKTATETAGSLGVKFSFDRVDTKSIEALNRRFVWLRDDASPRTQQRLKGILSDVMRGAKNRTELGDILRDEFQTLADVETRKITAGAEHLIRQSQNISKVKQALKYNVQYMQLWAKLDRSTTAFCRSVHGRLVPISHIANQVDRIESAKNVKESIRAVDMNRGKEFFFTKDLPENMGLPPFHFGCRTTTFPVRQKEITIGSKKARYVQADLRAGAKKDGKTVRFAHTDRTGTERWVSDTTLDHAGKKREIPDETILGALNGIQMIGPKNDGTGRLIAGSQNGHIMIFEGPYMVTIYKRKNWESYLRQNTIPGTHQIIKFWKVNAHAA